ncbi:MAG: serine/threonine protein kinase [Fibrobacteres bacterium]|nr:serine/threonine protein kinase [Fibrobacterota bacterium]
MKMVCPFCHRRIDGDSAYCMFCGERVAGSLQQLANAEPRQTPELPPVPPKPRNADRYKELVMIGKGGMGEVWSARDSRLNRKVAIKRILAKYMKSSTVLHRFLREARSIAQLSHYNIVQIYELEQDETGIYIVMEYVDGSSVLEHLRQKGPYSVAEIIPILSQMCDALTMAHDRGIIHRDIKPANILLTSGGVPKLVDFGLAHEPESDSTAIGSVLGTVDFMAPEQRCRPPTSTAAPTCSGWPPRPARCSPASGPATSIPSASPSNCGPPCCWRWKNIPTDGFRPRRNSSAA